MLGNLGASSDKWIVFIKIVVQYNITHGNFPNKFSCNILFINTTAQLDTMAVDYYNVPDSNYTNKFLSEETGYTLLVYWQGT